MDLNNIKEAVAHLNKGIKLLSNGPLEFYLTELIGAHEYLMARFAPFLVGDRVALTVRPDYSNNLGWRGSEHFLVPGALATVVSIECGSKGFRVAVQFDEETFINTAGEKVPVSQKHTFTVSENSLVKIP